MSDSDSLDFMDENPKKKKGKKPFFGGPEPKASNIVGSYMTFSEALEEFDLLPTLSGATVVGQWVKATNRPYRFFVNTDSTRMAFLWHNGTLSVRLEPNKTGWTKNYVTNLKGFGMTVDPSYASIHLEVGNDPTLARKALGSVVMGTMPHLKASDIVQIAWEHLPPMMVVPLKAATNPEIVEVPLGGSMHGDITALLAKQKQDLADKKKQEADDAPPF